MSGITEGIAVSIEHIAQGLGSILDKIVSLRDSLITKLKESDNLVTQFWGNMFEKVAGLQDAVLGKFSALLDWTSEFRQNFVDKIQELIEWGSGNWKDFFDWTAEIRQFFIDKFLDLKDWIVGNWEKFFEWTGEIRQFFLDKFTDLFEKLLAIRQHIIELPVKIYDKMKELFEEFFVPDAELMNERLDAINEKFAFIDSFTGYGEHLVNFLQNAAGTKAPVITINLAAYEGSYGWGSAGAVTLDFSWYARYKPAVDNLLAGIIWANWLWHLYKRIPEIIHGQGMTAERAIDISGRDI